MVQRVTFCCIVDFEWTSEIEYVTIMDVLNLNAMIGIIVYEKPF